MLPTMQADCDWKPLYEAALLETDESKIVERIMAARNAIFDRMESTLHNPVPSEHRAMNEALRNLRKVAEVTASRIAA